MRATGEGITAKVRIFASGSEMEATVAWTAFQLLALAWRRAISRRTSSRNSSGL